MGYIICEECGDFYELQPGEHPEDFSRCHCGGKLRYERQMIDNYNAQSPESGFKLPPLSKSLKIIGIGAVAIIIALIKFLPAILGFLMFSFYSPASSGQSSIFGQNIPYYLVPILVIISIIAARILGPRRW